MNKYTDEELDALRDKYFTSALRKSYGTFKGYTVTNNFLNIQKDIEDFEVFDDDVWVCTFAKCGTTWTQEMVWCMSNNFDFEGAKVDLNLRFPFFDINACFWAKDQEYQPDFIKNSVEYCKNLKRPRFIKTHLPWPLLPKQIRTFEKRPKMIFVARNPMDVAVSYYYHSRRFNGYDGDFDLYAQMFLKNKQIWTPFDNFLLDYHNQRHEPNLLYLKFEDFIRNLPEIVDKLAHFLKLTLSAENKAELLRHVSFEAMKKNDAVSHKLVVEFLEKNNVKCNQKQDFMRSGKSGGFKKEMSEEMVEVFKRRFMDRMDKEGLFFPM